MDNPSIDIEIRGLSFAYPDGTPALSAVDLRVEQGSRVGLIGPNGAGKSTLLLHVDGLLRGAGDISVLGLTMTRSDLPRIRQEVGLVFQNPDDQLFMPTVFDEVAYSAVNAGYSEEEIERRVAEALATVGISGLEAKHPVNLSIGQKKRVALASVLVTDNRLLLLDEPSAGLDPAGRRALIELLRSLPSTMLIASHDLDLVGSLCGRVAVMSEGTIVEVGSAAEVLADRPLLERHGL